MDNILLIGNGFDLEHKYPTSYLEFADIVETFISLYENEVIMSSSGLSCIEKPKYDYLDWFIFSYEKYSKEFYELIKNNCWIKLFDRKYTELAIGDNWYDLERIVKDEVNNLNSEVMLDYDAAIEDFNKFRRAFEIYVDLFVEFARERQSRKPVSNRIANHIREINAKYILNYNYTDTFTKLYNKDVYVDYLHGKAQFRGTIDTCNIVFGIDTITLPQRKNKYKDYTKEYQCKKFGIETKYHQWLNGKRCNLHIYGHSLDETDKDSLKDILLHPSVNDIYIWEFDEVKYHSKLDALKNILPEQYNAISQRVNMKMI